MSVYKTFILLVFNRECRNFCLANHDCVSHLLRGQPRLLECYYWNCLIGTYMCVHPVSEWSVFLPFTVNCSQVEMFQIMPALCPHGQREGGWSTKCGQAWTGGGGSLAVLLIKIILKKIYWRWFWHILLIKYFASRTYVSKKIKVLERFCV